MQETNETLPAARKDFKIWQQNLRKSAYAWEHIIRNLDPNIYDLACIQEPYLNPVNLANALNLRQFWDILYPMDHHTNTRHSQMIMLVNKKLSKNICVSRLICDGNHSLMLVGFSSWVESILDSMSEA